MRRESHVIEKVESIDKDLYVSHTANSASQETGQVKMNKNEKKRC